ncbi:bifunctional lysylphosphatidylglycerol flippase/synthetase MprF [Oceanicella sp. SM1341]|uniref:bifunctional lysylphosphatidylglycerol flippase/synthetase MprF n=1 Tax=Oceanicella sp. SM1341 TaxID=1548889 RepID=UPI000E491292|nr:phosphatidylglycerol lysyltransferase domain-containing protein [Oceanicella sp. SM1341]
MAHVEGAVARRVEGAVARRGWMLRAAAMVGLVGLSLWMLGGELAAIRAADVMSRLREVTAETLLLAVALAVPSYLAMACYDLVALRQLRISLPRGAAMRAGLAAAALSQGLGFGMITGALVRWRMHRRHALGAAEAGALSMLVCLGFFFGMGGVMAVLAVADPEALAGLSGLAPEQLSMIGACGLAALLPLGLLAMLQPRLRIAGRELRLPPPRLLAMQVLLAALDVVPAGMVLWLLLPGAPELAGFLALFTVAMAAGMVSNAPGGIGAFELAMFTALPHLPQADLAAALLLYRVVYHGLPFLLGLGLFGHAEFCAAPRREPRPAAARRLPPARVGQVPAPLWPALAQSRQAEAGLARAGDKEFLLSPCGEAFAMLRESAGCLVMMGDPVGAEAAWPRLAASVLAEARGRMLRPAFYRCGAGFAAHLADAGLRADRLGAEAVVAVPEFSTAGAARRELRRKLGQAERAGVVVSLHAPGRAPMARMRSIAEAWQAARGRETGFSMGRFDPAYLAGFPVLEARCGEETVGFLSLWSSGDGREWGLDVMRLAADAPSGSMHALVCAGIEAARAAGATRFSLCMAPLAGAEPGADRLLERLAARFWEHDRLSGLRGLQRFKQGFRPEWEPRFLMSTARVLPWREAFAIRRCILAGPGLAEQEGEELFLPGLGEAAPAEEPVTVRG